MADAVPSLYALMIFFLRRFLSSRNGSTIRAYSYAVGAAFDERTPDGTRTSDI
jgi:hypothetical protein